MQPRAETPGGFIETALPSPVSESPCPPPPLRGKHEKAQKPSSADTKTCRVFRGRGSNAPHAFRVSKGFRAFSCSAEGHDDDGGFVETAPPYQARPQNRHTRHQVPGTLPSVSGEARFCVFCGKSPPLARSVFLPLNTLKPPSADTEAFYCFGNERG